MKSYQLFYSISPSTNLHPNLIDKILWLWLGQIYSIADTLKGSINYGYSIFLCGSVAQLAHVKLKINRRRYINILIKSPGTDLPSTN
jgi:hypothetical protein